MCQIPIHPIPPYKYHHIHRMHRQIQLLSRLRALHSLSLHFRNQQHDAVDVVDEEDGCALFVCLLRGTWRARRRCTRCLITLGCRNSRFDLLEQRSGASQRQRSSQSSRSRRERWCNGTTRIARSNCLLPLATATRRTLHMALLHCMRHHAATA